MKRPVGRPPNPVLQLARLVWGLDPRTKKGQKFNMKMYSQVRACKSPAAQRIIMGESR